MLYQLSYSHHKVVGEEGFEPPTSCSQSRRATRLRYTPTLTLTVILPDETQFTPTCKPGGIVLGSRKWVNSQGLYFSSTTSSETLAPSYKQGDIHHDRHHP